MGHGRTDKGTLSSSYICFILTPFRTDLQRTFFPPTYRDSEVTHRLKPGDKRTWTSLQIFIELREETSLHIPFREASKVLFV